MYRPLEGCEWTLGCSVSNKDGGSDIGPDTRDRPLGVLPVALSRPTLVLGTPHAQVGSELPRARGALDATVPLRRGAAGDGKRRVGSIARKKFDHLTSPVLKTTLAKASPKSVLLWGPVRTGGYTGTSPLAIPAPGIKHSMPTLVLLPCTNRWLHLHRTLPPQCTHAPKAYSALLPFLAISFVQRRPLVPAASRQASVANTLGLLTGSLASPARDPSIPQRCPRARHTAHTAQAGHGLRRLTLRLCSRTPRLLLHGRADRRSGLTRVLPPAVPALRPRIHRGSSRQFPAI